MQVVQVQRMSQNKAQCVLAILRSPSETRPINCGGSKPKGCNSLKLKPKCINIKSTVPYVHARLIYVHAESVTTSGKYRGLQVMEL